MKIDFNPDIIFTPKVSGTLYRAPDFRTPETIDCRDYLLATENQGSTPQCAAYSGTSYLERFNWMRTGKPVNLPPAELYAHAKTIDGHPDEDGTTLEAIMKGMIQLGWTDRKESDIRFFDDSQTLKRVIHKYGCALIACDICTQWQIQMGLDMEKSIGNPLGGHAVICCGFDREGVFIQNSWGNIWGKFGFCRIHWGCFNKEFRIGAYYANITDGMEGN